MNRKEYEGDKKVSNWVQASHPDASGEWKAVGGGLLMVVIMLVVLVTVGGWEGG